jgi:osmotically inducible protein OsmC
MSALYKTKAIAVGGRHGHVHTDDNLLSTRLALPKTMGGKEDATNPEQLFAAGYAACFGNAVLHVARQQKIALKDADVEIDAQVGIVVRAEGGFALEVSLAAILSGMDQVTAERLVQTAHQVCPYSNATRGSIDVALSVRTR